MASRLATAIAVQDAHLTATAQQAEAPLPRPPTATAILPPTPHGDPFHTWTPTPTPGVGAMISGENWLYQVTKVERVNVIRDPVSGAEETPAGQWLIVYLNLRTDPLGSQRFNTHPSPSFHEIHERDFTLYDSAWIKYNASSSSVLSSWLRNQGMTPLGRQFPPGAAFRTALVFDINPTATGLQLWREGRYIALD